MTALTTPASRPPTMPVPQLRRVRWAVRATLTLGVAASVAANILHARANPISQVIAAWPPLALLLTVELISRIPVYRRSLGVVRVVATAAIASIAAWVSYWHMAGVAARYGEAGASPYLLPLSVDGLVIVASVSLVELAGRLRATQQASLAGSPRLASQTRTSPAVRGASVPAVVPPTTAPLPHDGADIDQPPAAPALNRNERPPVPRDDNSRKQPLIGTSGPATEPAALSDTAPEPEPPLPPQHEPNTKPAGEQRADPADAPTVPSQTAAAVAHWYWQDPAMHPAVIAEKIGKSERTVRRYWPPRPPDQPGPPVGVNGRHLPDLASAVTPD